MIKYIYFDFDWVLTLNEDAYVLMSQLIAEEFWSDYQTILNSLSNYRHDLALWDLQFEDCWKEFCSSTWVDIDLNYFYSDIVTNLKKNEEMFDLVRELKRCWYWLGIITNNPKKRFEILSALRWIDHTFECASLPSEAGSLKNSKEIFEDALTKAWSIDSNQAIFIDNKEKNLVIPKELWFLTYHHDTYLNDIDALKRFLLSQNIDVTKT